MTQDVSALWMWLVLAVLVGAAFGWRERQAGAQGPWLVGWTRTAAIVWAAALLASILHVFSGRAAFWLESAVLFGAAYGVGVWIGGALGARRSAA